MRHTEIIAFFFPVPTFRIVFCAGHAGSIRIFSWIGPQPCESSLIWLDRDPLATGGSDYWSTFILWRWTMEDSPFHHQHCHTPCGISSLSITGQSVRNWLVLVLSSASIWINLCGPLLGQFMCPSAAKASPSGIRMLPNYPFSPKDFCFFGVIILNVTPRFGRPFNARWPLFYFLFLLSFLFCGFGRNLNLWWRD